MNKRERAEANEPSFRESVDATVLITTKNRKASLKDVLLSLSKQEACFRTVVFDDGSTDGTAEMLRSDFPLITVFRAEKSMGIICARNKAISLCEGRIVIVIDDDCTLPSSSTVAQTISDFDHHRIAAVAIPHYNPSHELPPAAAPPGRYVISQFTGCAHAVDMKTFKALGGFREEFWRQNEETDFCTRLLEAGFVTRVGTAEPIRHLESPLSRNKSSIAFYIVRNRILYAWRNVPGWRAPLHLAVAAAASILGQLRGGYARAAVRGAVAAIRTIAKNPSRQPVSTATYIMFRRLRKGGPMPLSTIEQGMNRKQALSSRNARSEEITSSSRP